MDKPSTSSELVNPRQRILRAEDIGLETNKFVQRVIWKITQEESSTADDTSNNDVVSRVVKYTGIHKNVITKMLDTKKPQIIEQNDIIIDRRIIQDSLISAYFKERRMPTVTEMFNALEYLLPCYVDIDTFKKMLIKLGYVFHTYDNRNTLYVMEKKYVTFQRYKYLKTMQQYRNDNANIYYIGIVIVSNDQEILNLENIIQTDPSNIAQYIFFTANEGAVEHISVVPSGSYDMLKTWFTNDVLPELPLHSVCVLLDSEIYRKKIIDVPTLNSVKVDLVEWLEYHNIPCTTNMSKSELLRLVETCTNTNKNTYEIDNIVETYGHKLIRLPECVNGLCLAAQVLDLLNKNVILTGTTSTFLGNISEERLSLFSDCLKKEEVRLLEEDINVDDIFDEIVANTKENTINEDDFLFGFSDSD